MYQTKWLQKNDKRCVLFIKIKKPPSCTTVDQLYEKFTQC